MKASTPSRTPHLSPDRRAIEGAVARAYALSDGAVDNEELYRGVAEQLTLPLDELDAKRPIGKAGARRSPSKRAIRWAQQSMKMRGWLERVENERGKWRVTRVGRAHLRQLAKGQRLIAFSTHLGIAVWGNCSDAIDTLQDEITLLLTSPPYPIQRGRAYGAVSEREYVDWLCSVLAPFIQRLRPGGNLVLNVGNDVFMPGSPARSTYQERLVLALTDRYGLHKLDNLIWHASNKPPGPIAWASKQRCQLNFAYESVLWFSNDPTRVVADNRRVLQPHSARHRKELGSQSFGRARTSADGAYSHRPGKSFANMTEGRIPRNVLKYSITCPRQRAVKAAAREAGLPPHGAVMPLSLARFLVRFLCDEGGLTADPMAGTLTTAHAAEIEGVPWWAAEQFGEYVAQSAAAFAAAPGFRCRE